MSQHDQCDQCDLTTGHDTYKWSKPKGANARPKWKLTRDDAFVNSHETENELHYLNVHSLQMNINYYSKCSGYIHDFYIMNYNVALIHIMTSIKTTVILILTNKCKSIYDVYYLKNYKL